MENQYQPQFQGPKPTLPNATAVLVLGICSIVFSCVFVGCICGIIGLVLASKGRTMYRENPSLYEGYGQLNAGWIMSIIGVVLGGLSIIYSIFWGMAVWTAASHHNYGY
jgi:M penetrans paralogue family 26